MTAMLTGPDGLAERSALYREELAGVGAGPERPRLINDHARDRALSREHEVRHDVRAAVVEPDPVVHFVSEPNASCRVRHRLP